MDLKAFVKESKFLYNLTADDALDSIFQYGLLSTEKLLELFEEKDPRRRDLLEEHRPKSVTLSHPKYGQVVIRDTGKLDVI